MWRKYDVELSYLTACTRRNNDVGIHSGIVLAINSVLTLPLFGHKYRVTWL